MTQSQLYSRRKLLYSLGLGSVGVATASWTGPLAAANNPLAGVLPRVLSSVNQGGFSDWSSAIGSSFLIRNGGSSSSVTLVAVTALNSSGKRPAGARASAFALAFEGTNGATFPAGNQTYVFQQPNGASLQLFVTAKSVTGTTARLTAVLN